MYQLSTNFLLLFNQKRLLCCLQQPLFTQTSPSKGRKIPKAKSNTGNNVVTAVLGDIGHHYNSNIVQVSHLHFISFVISRSCHEICNNVIWLNATQAKLTLIQCGQQFPPFAYVTCRGIHGVCCIPCDLHFWVSLHADLCGSIAFADCCGSPALQCFCVEFL